MASNLMGAGNRPHMGRTAADIKADQERAEAADQRAARAEATFRGRHSIQATRVADEDEW